MEAKKKSNKPIFKQTNDGLEICGALAILRENLKTYPTQESLQIQHNKIFNVKNTILKFV